ncbi:MAG: ABC transporter ATPase, partial [Gemmatimonadota bacterium]|nr:ABC transporter ATPase [Gemmatimonadota bacterium]
MPIVEFEDLPDSSRVWVFGSDRRLEEEEAVMLLEEVDRFLAGWKAHGAPLTVGRNWRHDRFLAVAVDQSTAGASGCSIDGLFR